MKSIFGTWHIYINGLVQGVGFRPLVYKEALEYGLKGWVKNDNDGVHIEVNTSREKADIFYERIIKNPPQRAKITVSNIIQVAAKDYRRFEIIHDTMSEHAKVHLTPDFATCDNCRSELFTSKNRRYQYPFITCSECGPRYSIMHRLPYDRENTSMDVFTMCQVCKSEYSDPADRRYFAQTNSCPSCSIGLALYNSKKEELSNDITTLKQIISKKWSQGEIVAIKGIGGYLLTCCASNATAIATLRVRKRRPHKPFALMYQNIDLLDEYGLCEEEVKAISDQVSPIVLVSKPEKNQISEGICDSLSRVGVMLPYAPLFELLLGEYKKPIIATSGNIYNAPIVFQDEKALNELFEIADLVLVHNREIVVPQDDSVVAYTSYFKKRVVFRRSRGLAPTYFNDNLKLTSNNTLAMGAFMKSTFTACHNGNIYISQYLGDLDDFDTQQNYIHTLNHLMGLLRLSPEKIVVDMHSDFLSTQEGKTLASRLDIPLLEVQHHMAHFAALIGEHNLIHTEEKVLGVIWDGTGMGNDGNIWGGEFFIYHDYQFDRCSHLPYFHHIANDKMAKEPRLSALALGAEIEEALELIQSKFTALEWKIYTQKLKNKKLVKTSSIGRLFDAVASVLGLSDIQTYEGQAAGLLQVKAEEHFKAYGIDYNISYCIKERGSKFSGPELLRLINSDLRNEIDVSCIAAKFHLTLVHWIDYIATVQKVAKIGFSGGVFQNTLLIDLVIFHLDERYELLFNQDLSPNDENISFGQLMYAEIEAKRLKICNLL
ncbi:carbamoyltransferase HypF [Cecembia sp.]|uniref:carbamoyltransferase HypF n=1 Tax=Cecembia sp. TaxID=1898110 RepID=UPI0025B7F710|nr:carbamoyltransferase HypF [Cecembia sp.]